MRRLITRLLLAICLVVGVVWLMRDRDGGSVPPQKAGAPQALVRETGGSNPPAASEGDRARAPDGQGGIANSAYSAKSAAPGVRLGFEMPPAAKVGDAFDLNVAINAEQPVGRIAVELVYDPALIRMRLSEEIDYSNRPPADRAFLIRRAEEGRAAVVMNLVEAQGAALTGRSASVAVAQFEALAPGLARVNITSIETLDGSSRSIPHTATGTEGHIALN